VEQISTLTRHVSDSLLPPSALKDGVLMTSQWFRHIADESLISGIILIHYLSCDHLKEVFEHKTTVR